MSRQRITQADLQGLADHINHITNSPAQPWQPGVGGANIGNYHISYVYGGACLHRMTNEGGACNAPIVHYHVPKRDLYERMQAFIRGIEVSVHNRDELIRN